MAIDTKEPFSPGWWMDLLSKQLAAKQNRLRVLDDYYMGRPSLIHGTPNQQSVFYRFQRVAKTNLAALIVQARRERIAVRAIRTAADFDEDGDQVAWDLYQRNNMDETISTLTRHVCVFGEGILAAAVGANDQPRILAEDPRQVITWEDPVTGETLAAFKLFHDYLTGTDYAMLWVPGVRYVAAKQRRISTPRQDYAQGPPPPPRVTFSASTFDMLPFADEFEDGSPLPPVLSERYDFTGVPVSRVAAQDGVGVFELHTDLLDRINHTILQRVVIATMQAFKQRGIELTEDLPEFDQDGQKIDYNDVFSADPGALWKLPPGAKIWESGQVDLQGILSSIKDDILHGAAVTQTPLSMFTPDAATQTAEGAQMQREGLVFGVEYLQRSLGRGLRWAFSTAFELAQDTTRADMAKLAVEWLPAERYSLAEKAAADSQAQSLTWEQRQRVIWQQTPSEIQRAGTQRAQDAMQGLLAASPAATGGQVTSGANAG